MPFNPEIHKQVLISKANMPKLNFIRAHHRRGQQVQLDMLIEQEYAKIKRSIKA
jgi:hypothetical protein